MVDYQTWASIAIILQAIFTGALVYLTYQYKQATDKYVTTTKKILKEIANYSETTEEILEASIIDRKIDFYEKRLEKLFMPIYNNRELFQYLPNAFNEFEKMNVSNFTNDIKSYTYLADGTLRINLEKLLNKCSTLSPEEAEAKRNSEEYKKLKEEILNGIKVRLRKDRVLLKKMMRQHKIKSTVSGKLIVI